MNIMIADHTGSAILSALNSDTERGQQLLPGKTYRMKMYDISELKSAFRKEASVSVQFYIKPKTTIEAATQNDIDNETITPLSQAHEHSDAKSYMVFVETVGHLEEKKKTRNGERSFRSLKVWDCSQTASYRIDLWGHIATIFLPTIYEKKVVYFNNLLYTQYNNGGLQSSYNKTYYYISESTPATTITNWALDIGLLEEQLQQERSQLAQSSTKRTERDDSTPEKAKRSKPTTNQPSNPSNP
ncbi:uncharacterized protein LOC129601426 [Paramacrobiotus metropolitanus]|uniref:uncharacterized protein LOC129601426 n=1 Tax=Paramacrobiotus metropolitanus TaxID=2943436 RepID=UPI002445A58A|nr:uncharacterized protein LOC129601426 [Paramacrobiotus metropolitanus]